MRWASCGCWLYQNIFLPRFNQHVRYTEKSCFHAVHFEQFNRSGFSETDLDTAFHLAQSEHEKRKETESVALQTKLFNLEVYKPHVNSGFILQQEDFTDASRKLRQMSDSSSVETEELLTSMEEVDGLVEVYRFPLLNAACLDRLNHLLDLFDQQGCKRDKPNTMNYGGVTLSVIPGSQARNCGEHKVDCGGADVDFTESLLDLGLRSILTRLFPDLGFTIDSYRSFTVEYSDSTLPSHDDDRHKDKELAAHYDNSEITLNICLRLTNGGGGGRLYFCHRSPYDDPLEFAKPIKEVEHQPGWVIIHRGRHVHGVHPFLSSDGSSRRSIIVWLRCSSTRNKRCPRCFLTPNLIPMKVWYNGHVINCTDLPPEVESQGNFVRAGFGDGMLLTNEHRMCTSI
ncbi:unnamed protein product [Dicrocoelium dendriticum]|nr:unnamed protein product [Dicrocoelium dendriticum]